MPSEPTAAPLDRRALLLASVAAMAAIVTLPLTASAPPVAGLTMFGIPLVAAVVGRVRGWPGLYALAGIALVVLLVARLTTLTVAGNLALMVVLAGPVLAVVLVGPPLRAVDVGAAAGLLLGGTIAVVAGFATTGLSATGSALTVGVAAVVSLGVVAARLPRS